MTKTDHPLTKQDLIDAFAVLGGEIRGEMHDMETRITSNLREELDEKLAISEARMTRTLMDHTEEVVAANDSELLSLIADVFQPTQAKVADRGIRIRRLERAATRRRTPLSNA